MTEEDKLLLKIDLSSRFPYISSVKVFWINDVYDIIGIGFGRVTLIKPFMSVTAGSPLISEVKPLLIPIKDLDPEEGDLEWEILPDGRVVGELAAFDFFNKNEIDYRGLIERGLAINKNNFLI